MSYNQSHMKGSFRREEAVAAATITPGMLLEITSAGKFQAASTEGGYTERIVAEVDALQGHSMEDDYAADALVAANVELPGNEAAVLLQAGQNAVIGSLLISGGDGTLIVNGQEDSTTTVRQIVAKSLEALNLTDSLAVNTLLNVRFL